MAFIVKIGLTPKLRRVGLRIDQIRNNTPSVPDQPDQPCSLVKLDMDAYKWQVLMEPEGFRKLYGGTQGSIARGVTEGADVTLLHPTQPDVRLLTLLSMTFTARAKVKGKVVANFTQGTGQPEIYTYFWRELEYPEMTYLERMQEIIQICCQNYLQGAAREEFGNLASAGNLAMAAATMLFFLAPVGLAVNAIRAVVGYALLGSSLQLEYEYYKARVIDIQYACNKSNVSKNEMNTAGKSLAEILMKIMDDIAMMKLGHALAKGANWVMERGRLSRLFTSKSKQEWEAAGRKEEGQAHPAARGTGSVVNSGWVKEIAPSEVEGIGMLEGELKAFRALANKGYYVVCRSCNAARLRWLRKGIAINGKPLWIKTKSLKGLKNAFYEGLTGMRKDGRDTIYSLDHLEPVKNLPSNFKVEFMQKGQSAQGKVYKLKTGRSMDEISGHENEIYFVDVGEAYVITDNRGRAYIPDLDVVLFQKRLASGGYGPPGMNTAMGKQPGNYSGGDHALIEADFNAYFRRFCHYPDGYEPVQHGGGAGTAGYLKKAKDDINLTTRKPGWSPIRPTEGECVVAVQGLPGEVGIARTWHDVAAFHQANPFGEWRW